MEKRAMRFGAVCGRPNIRLFHEVKIWITVRYTRIKKEENLIFR